MKHRVIGDIKNSSVSKKKKSLSLINLVRQKTIVFPVSFIGPILAFAVVLTFVLGSASAPSFNGVRAAQTSEQRAELERQLAEYEKQIEETQATINQYKSQGNTLKSEISRLESQITKLNLQIKAINLSLSQLDEQIKDTTSQISRTEDDIETKKQSLAQTLQALYEKDSEGLVEVMLKNPKFSDFFGDLNNLLSVQDSLRVTLNEVVDARQRLIGQKETLALERADAVALKAYQDAQKANIAKTQDEKNQLLKDTKGKEAEYQKILEEKKKTAAEIRQQIFKLLGGGQLEFGEAYKLAKFAEDATGVSAAMILAILDRESNLGQNVGQCQYDINPYYSDSTTMHPTRDIPTFLDITSRLGLDPKSTLVSCPIKSHGTYGGAMGPAQFIPSTWALYETKIAKITGSKPPSPWNNGDAFVATAVYLKDLLNSSSCKSYAEENKNIVPYQTLLERCAAAKYYSGGNWYTYRFWYGEPVVLRAREFEEDIAILNS
jgi:peptidoglycan hydrolase CwlO-like protein